MVDGQIDWKLQPHHRITEEQFNSILGAAAEESPRDWMLLYLSGNTGLRICEVLHFQLQDFIPNIGIRILRRKKEKLQADTLVVAPGVFACFHRYVEVEKIEGPWVFPGASTPCYRNIVIHDRKAKKKRRENQRLCDGGHLSVRRGQQIWDRAVSSVGLKVPGRGIHTLRHYDATQFYTKTRDLRATQQRLGHSSPTVTQIYADVVDMQEKTTRAGTTGGPAPWERKRHGKQRR